MLQDIPLGKVYSFADDTEIDMFTKTIKISKNKLRIGLAVALMGLLLVFLVIFRQCFIQTAISSNVGTRARTIGRMYTNDDAAENTVFRQHFSPRNTNLDYIEIRIATYTDDTASGYIRLTIFNETEAPLEYHDVQIALLKDNEYQRFSLRTELDPQKTYSYTLEAFEYGWENPPVVWLSEMQGLEQTQTEFSAKSNYPGYQACSRFGYTFFSTGTFIGCILLSFFCGVVILLEFKFTPVKQKWFAIISLFLSPSILFFLAEALNGNSVMKKTNTVFFLNYIFYFLLYFLVFAVFGKIRVALLTVNTITYSLALINYFKLQFRGEPLQPWDIFSAGTALGVMGNYDFNISVHLIITGIFFILLNLIHGKCNYRLPKLRYRISYGITGAVLSGLLVFSLFGADRYTVAAINFMQKIGIENDVWNQPSNYVENGLVIALTMNAQYMNVNVPEAYSIKEIEKIRNDIRLYAPFPETETTKKLSSDLEDGTNMAANDYVYDNQEDITDQVVIPDEDDVKEAEERQLPNIIAIMNESFADLSIVGDFTTNQEVTPFINSLKKNTVKGSLYVSTYGGGTANTEFEFLTGNSMAFLPKGSVPYQQYIKDNTGSLARTLNEQGYTSYAIHPFNKKGWNRPAVYENFGFTEFISREDFENPSIVRGYVSDAASYEKIVSLYEEKEEEQPIFVFDVTMQNHGSYSYTYENFKENVKLPEYPGQFPETEQYLSLLQESDKAVKELIEYFSEVDEPTAILFFGDHLPNLKDNFYQKIIGGKMEHLKLEEMLKLYQTPFFIWTNYDIGSYEIEAISANYLSTLLMQVTGIDMPDYNLYLSQMYKEYPVISSMAVADHSGKIYENPSEAPKQKILENYNILLYNNLFDPEQRMSELFENSASPGNFGNLFLDGFQPPYFSKKEEQVLPLWIRFSLNIMAENAANDFDAYVPVIK